MNWVRSFLQIEGRCGAAIIGESDYSRDEESEYERKPHIELIKKTGGSSKGKEEKEKKKGSVVVGSPDKKKAVVRRTAHPAGIKKSTGGKAPRRPILETSLQKTGPPLLFGAHQHQVVVSTRTSR